GGVLLLLNNANEKEKPPFTAQAVFPGVTGARSFVWSDLDNDGAPDAALLDDQGALHVFMNEWSGRFTKLAVPGDNRFAALTAGKLTEVGRFALVAATQDGRLLQLSRDGHKGWETKEIAKLNQQLPLTPGQTRLQAIDVDSNGAIDFVLRTPKGGAVWLAE